MIMKIYTIKDTKVAYRNPFLCNNDAEATRMLKNLVNDKKSPNDIERNPEDNELWALGAYNNQTGEIEPKIEFIVKAIDLKQGE